MKVTIHLNADRDAVFGDFTPSKAVLTDAGTYDLPASEFIPARIGLTKVMTDAEADENIDLYAQDVLNKVYEQLNVGGELVPAEAYTEAYRAAGHRSLSVGDLVTLDGTDTDLFGFRGTYAVARFGFKKVPAAGIVIRRGLTRAACQEALAW